MALKGSPRVIKHHGLVNWPLVAEQYLKIAKIQEASLQNSYLDDFCISLPVFLSRTNLKVHSIFITLKVVKKVIANLDSSKASCPDCISIVILKTCELELSYILAELFNMCLKGSCFIGCWKVSSVVPVFKNVGETTTLLVFLLWLVKSLKNL